MTRTVVHSPQCTKGNTSAVDVPQTPVESSAVFTQLEVLEDLTDFQSPSQVRSSKIRAAQKSMLDFCGSPQAAFGSTYDLVSPVILPASDSPHHNAADARTIASPSSQRNCYSTLGFGLTWSPGGIEGSIFSSESSASRDGILLPSTSDLFPSDQIGVFTPKNLMNELMKTESSSRSLNHPVGVDFDNKKEQLDIRDSKTEEEVPKEPVNDVLPGRECVDAEDSQKIKELTTMLKLEPMKLHAPPICHNPTTKKATKPESTKKAKPESTKKAGHGRRLCSRCFCVHHYRTPCTRTDSLSPALTLHECPATVSQKRSRECFTKPQHREAEVPGLIYDQRGHSNREEEKGSEYQINQDPEQNGKWKKCVTGQQLAIALYTLLPALSLPSSLLPYTFSLFIFDCPSVNFSKHHKVLNSTCHWAGCSPKKQQRSNKGASQLRLGVHITMEDRSRRPTTFFNFDPPSPGPIPSQALSSSNSYQKWSEPTLVQANTMTCLVCRKSFRSLQGMWGHKPWCAKEKEGEVHDPGATNEIALIERKPVTPTVKSSWPLLDSGAEKTPVPNIAGANPTCKRLSENTLPEGLGCST